MPWMQMNVVSGNASRPYILSVYLFVSRTRIFLVHDGIVYKNIYYGESETRMHISADECTY